MRFFKVFSLLFCYILYQNVNGYRFLGVLPVPSKSHYYIGHNLLKGLALEGHDVTVISPFKEKKPIKNYNEVFLEHSWVNSRESKVFPMNHLHEIEEKKRSKLLMCFPFLHSYGER